MANLNIPVGVSDFAEIRKNGYYFIDKSELIAKLVKTKATKVTLITRPRRFGKTLGMSMLQRRIAELCRQYVYLTESENVNPFDKKIFMQLVDVVDGKTTDTMLKTSISLIMQMLHDHYGKPVILLLDEYDVPLAKASAHGYYEQMLDMMPAYI